MRPLRSRTYCKSTSIACHAFLLAVLAGFFLLVGIVNGSDRPNILWITAEDMSPTLGCYGDEYATTPNIDRLARQSVRYTNAFATAPVCSPSRSCLITGVFAPRLGTHQMRSAFAVPEFMRGFPALLRDVGYYTTNNLKTDYNTSSEPRIIASSWNESGDTAHWRKREDKSRPFFSVFNIMTSHQSRSMVWTQERFRDEVQSKLSQGDIHDPDRAPVPAYYPDNLVTRRIVARYYDCVSVMDQQVGRILQELDEDGLADHTIVFFYSDHGSGMPRHKRLLHDSGMHVPLLIRFPEKYAHLAPCDPGETHDQLISFVDFPPTVLNLARVETPDFMQGIPFLATNAGPREYVFGHRDRIDEVIDLSRSVRDKRYLYIRNYMPHHGWNQYSAYPDMSEIRHEIYRIADGSSMSTAQRHYAATKKPFEELYDCRRDPQNLENLAGLDRHSETLRRLKAELQQQLLRSNDLGFLAESRMWELFEDRPPYNRDPAGVTVEVSRAIAAAGRAVTDGETTAQKLLEESNPTLRFWGTIGLAAADSLSVASHERLIVALADESPAVRIEAAGALARHGQVEKSLPVLLASLEDKDLTVVLHATRTIELLGKAAIDAVPAMKKVSQRADRLQASDTPAVFAQTGEKDLAMFCSFSANGFLHRIGQGKWETLSAKASTGDWLNANTQDVTFLDTDNEIAMLSRGENLWIVHADEFEDFELTVEAKLPPDDYNAGIGFRCQVQPNGRPLGYQCEVAEELSGMLYAIDSGGWVWPKGDEQRKLFFEKVGPAFRPGRWNHFRIRCEGTLIQIWVNGIVTTDLHDDQHSAGRIALQHHGKGGVHRYRNVHVRRLNEDN